MKTRVIALVLTSLLISLSLVFLSEAGQKNRTIETSGVLEENKMAVSIPTELASIGLDMDKPDKLADSKFASRKPVGVVESLKVEPGDYVRTGDVLLVVDDGMAESNLSRVKARHDFVLASIGNLEEKGVDLTKKRKELDNTEIELKSKRASAQREFATKFATGKAQVAQVEKKLAEVNAGLIKARQGLAEVSAAEVQAKRALDNAQSLPSADPTKANRVIQASKALEEITKKKDSLSLTVKQLSIAKSNLEKGLSSARQALELGRKKFNEGLKKMDDAVAKLSDGRSKIEDAESNVNKKTVSLKKRKEQVEKSVFIAEKLLDATKIRATSPGRVKDLNIDDGSVVYPGQKVMMVVREDLLRLSIYVPLNDAGFLSRGMPVQVMVDAAPGKIFEGKIIAVGEKAIFAPSNMATNELELVRVVKVKVEVGNKDGILKAGMPADLKLETRNRKQDL